MKKRKSFSYSFFILACLISPPCLYAVEDVVPEVVSQVVESVQEVVAPSREHEILGFQQRLDNLKEKRRSFNKKNVDMPEVSQADLMKSESEINVGITIIEKNIERMSDPEVDFNQLKVETEDLMAKLDKLFFSSGGNYMEERRDYTRRIKIKLDEVELRLKKMKALTNDMEKSDEKKQANKLHKELRSRKLEIEKLLTEIWQEKEPQRSRSRIQSLFDDIFEKTEKFI